MEVKRRSCLLGERDRKIQDPRAAQSGQRGTHRVGTGGGQRGTLRGQGEVQMDVQSRHMDIQRGPGARRRPRMGGGVV